MTRISFIMPTYNRADLVAESLHAVMASAGEDDEILVVDDGSTDTTPQVVAALAPRVRYVRQANAGKSAALNRALALTDGAHVWICDDDDLLRPGAVGTLLAALESSGAGFVFGRHERFRMDPVAGRIAMGTGYWPDLSTGSVLRHLLEDAFVMQNAALVRRRCYRDVGPFDETFLRSQDYEMFVRLALRHRALHVDSTVFDQRKHDGARGPSAARHAVAGAEDIWRRFDRRIFETNAGLLSVPVFEALFEGTDKVLCQRAARLQRACVHARHDLWDRAIEDLRAAAAIGLDTPLHSVETAICARVLGGKHGFAGALAPPILGALRSLHNHAGGAIVRAILRGVLWRLRRDSPNVRSDARKLLAAVAGPVGTARILVEHAVKRSPEAIDDALRERSVESAPVASTGLNESHPTFV
ncbi:hypothetical protein GCM10007973_01200 [Polymorphobacter multimanifer]|uniref:Glycosyltransferase 2-like domain-containing protein n=1 Tax=Polymorphobacter multimanifer TaxID=1070431 RepID=A0A841L274_9SPHN|nr:glycosyltransferase family 2 protein [Polymorphobacter multimanifer]MBB6226416.1 hypothetical protein [Polymorphobacter multimanifer]GGI67827.1 hypothetical protein GCM10007973_01200 [Polymorphobacter multimanifer]